MEDSDDFSAQPTAQNKYNMEEKTPPESMLDKAKRAAERLRKEGERGYCPNKYAFSCYLCWKHGASWLKIEEQYYEGPEQFKIWCVKCRNEPKKKNASRAQMERFARAYPNVSISSYESRRRRLVWPEPRPGLQSEASRVNFEKLFGKD